MARKSNPELRTRILKEAEHLIHLRGYHCTSLEEIASRLKMTKANLLHHFKSKEDLGLAVLDYKIQAYHCDCLKPLLDRPNPIVGVRELFAWSGRFFQNNGCKAGCFIGNIALEMSDLNDRFRERASHFFEDWVQGLERQLLRHKLAGYFKPSLKPKAAAEAILALYEGAIMQARARRDPGVFQRIGHQACDLLKAHVKYDAHGPRAKRRP
jgi:TetR/AcrR family transcriptional repressor of nem operon